MVYLNDLLESSAPDVSRRELNQLLDQFDADHPSPAGARAEISLPLRPPEKRGVGGYPLGKPRHFSNDSALVDSTSTSLFIAASTLSREKECSSTRKEITFSLFTLPHCGLTPFWAGGSRKIFLIEL